MIGLQACLHFMTKELNYEGCHFSEADQIAWGMMDE